MVKKEQFSINLCDGITKFSVYLLVLLMPIFFLPWSSNVLDFNKQALLIVLVLVGLFSWMLKTLLLGEFTLSINKIHIVIGLLLLVYIAATIFSVFPYGSFWGWPQITSESLLSLIGLVILYFLVSNNFSEHDVFMCCNVLGISTFLVAIYGILQIFGVHLLPFNFAQSSGFNTIGSNGNLGLFLSAMLPLCVVIGIMSKKWWKILFIANVVLIFFALILINYNFIWWATLLGSGLIIIFGVLRRDIFEGRWMFLPMFFLIVSLFFILFSPQIRWLPQKSLEVYLSQQANFQIDLKALKASPILGSGPGTFAYDFAKYRDKDLNKNPLWNLNFNAGASKVLTSLATTGILGFIMLITLIVFPLFYGIEYLISTSSLPQEEAPHPEKISLILGILGILSVVSLGYFFYNSSVSSDFVYFFAIAALVALIYKNDKVYSLKSSSLLTLAVTFVFTAIFIFGLGFLMLDGQRYLAEVNYYRAIQAFRSGQKDAAIDYVKIAARNNTNLDLYFNQLALFSFSKLQDQIVESGANAQKAEDKKKIEKLFSDSINAANIAIDLNNKNIDNWLTKAYVCQNLIGVVNDAVDCAIQSYDKALELNPTNPYFLVQQGNTYLIQANTLPKDSAQNKDAILLKAKEKFDQALVLKENYSLAYLQLALVARAQGDTTEKVAALENAKKYSPNDAELALQIGLIYYQDKNWTKAQEEFQRALSISPNYANALYYSGLTYDKQGRNSDAIDAFAKILEANPNNENIKKILDNLRSGRAALEGLVAQPPAPTTTTTSPEPTNPPSEPGTDSSETTKKETDTR